MKTEVVTYDKFCQAAHRLVEQGEKLTVRNLLSQTGGSFSKIAAFLRRWQEEQSHAKVGASGDISANLRQALLAEIGRAVTEARTGLEKRVNDLTTLLNEATEVLEQREAALEGKAVELVELGQRLAVAERVREQQEQRIRELEAKVEETLKVQLGAVHEADKRAAVAEARRGELEKYITKLEQELRELKPKKASLGR